MKSIKYQIMTEINHGTDEKPNIVQTYTDCKIECYDDVFDSNYALALKEAYNGEVTVEDIPEPEATPTLDERVGSLEETTQQQAEILNILLSGETGVGV